MDSKNSHIGLGSDVLLEIIKIQTELVKLGLDFTGIMDFVTSNVQRLTGATGAILELAEGDEVVYRSATGMAKNQLGLRLQRSTSLSGMCIDCGRILKCDDSEIDARVNKEACRKVGLRSMVVAPLFYNEDVIGVLKIASSRPDAFTEGHVSILKLMSELIAAAMFYSEKYEINKLYHQATHDILTGLANRALFYDRLRQILALARRKSTKVGVLNLDMDGLKSINDQHGHRAGDAAIRELALRAKSALRQSDTVARLGGDEFAVILPEVENRGNAALAIDRIESTLRQPFTFEDKSLKLDASIGVALYPEDAKEMDELLEKADQSMYQVKRIRKRKQYAIHPPENA